MNAPVVFATVCNSRDVDSAKQLFYAASSYGRWTGDFLLLCRDLTYSQIEWFRNRGVIVRECKSVIDDDLWVAEKGGTSLPQVAMLKFYLFTEEFRRWKTIVYMDTDILIRGPIDLLSRIGGFRAVPDYTLFVIDQFTLEVDFDRSLHRKLSRTLAFNAGVFAFSPDRIPYDTNNRLVDLAWKYFRTCKLSDQSFLNLYFAVSWRRIPSSYNVLVNLYSRFVTGVGSEVLFNAKVVHFAGIHDESWKPASPLNPHYAEWKENLQNAELAGRFSKSPHTVYTGKTSRTVFVEVVLMFIRTHLIIKFKTKKIRRVFLSPIKRVLRSALGRVRRLLQVLIDR